MAEKTLKGLWRGLDSGCLINVVDWGEVRSNLPEWPVYNRGDFGRAFRLGGFSQYEWFHSDDPSKPHMDVQVLYAAIVRVVEGELPPPVIEEDAAWWELFAPVITPSRPWVDSLPVCVVLAPRGLLGDGEHYICARVPGVIAVSLQGRRLERSKNLIP